MPGCYDGISEYCMLASDCLPTPWTRRVCHGSFAPKTDLCRRKNHRSTQMDTDTEIAGRSRRSPGESQHPQHPTISSVSICVHLWLKCIVPARIEVMNAKPWCLFRRCRTAPLLGF